MTSADWLNLWRQLPRLEAERNMIAVNVSSWGNMKEHARRQLWNTWANTVASVRSDVVGAGLSVADSVRAVRRWLRQHGKA